jgi:hypothetical protein
MHPFSHSSTLPFIHSFTQLLILSFSLLSFFQPLVNAAEQHAWGYKAEHCNQIHCVTGRCQRQRRDRFCNAGIYPGGMTCPQAVRVPEARFMGSPKAMITTSLLSGMFRNPGHQAEFHHELFRWNKCIWIPHSGAYP